MNRSLARALSLVSLLAVPAGLIAQAAAAPATTTTTAKEAKATKKKVMAKKRHHKTVHHAKSTAPAPVPTPASK